MEKEPRAWKIEGMHFAKINEMEKMQSEALKDAVERITKFIDKQMTEHMKLKESLWKEIYKVLDIDPDGQYKLVTAARDVGILVVKERKRGEDRDEESESEMLSSALKKSTTVRLM